MSDSVLVTGIGGFIAKHVTRELLAAGFAVRGTVRSASRAERIRATLAAAGADASRLTFVEADLESDGGWRQAVAGCRYVQHIASPFPMGQVRDREGLVPVARGGTIRVLGAAFDAGVERVVLTSSTAAMMYQPNRPAIFPIREASWTDPEWDACSPYIISKTRAERAAWSLADERGLRARLAVVNPGFVVGPALDADVGTSLRIISYLLARKYPALPPIAFPVVDVRDVAALHLGAMTTPEAGGRRLLAASDTVSMRDMALFLKSGLGEKAARVPTMELPAFVVRSAALFDARLAAAVINLGVRPVAETGYVTALTGLHFRPAREAVVAAGESLVRLGLIPG